MTKLNKSKSYIHRGRSKVEAGRAITIRLTEEEHLLLVEMAEANLRSKTAQAVWIVKSEVASWEKIKRVIIRAEEGGEGGTDE